MSLKAGRQSILYQRPPGVLEAASIVGKKEGSGPLGRCFDMVLGDDMFGQKSFEKGERRIYGESIRCALRKARLGESDIDVMLGGDLLNQIITAGYASREFDIPFLGMYGACSTIAEALLVGSVLIDGGCAKRVACTGASHFSTAERQYRTPLEMGSQRTPSAQWTVTGSGCILLSAAGEGPHITSATIGKVIDFGITDANNMGAAMAPCAVDTLAAHFADTGRDPEYYDLIVSGDLGSIGREILMEKLLERGYDIKGRHIDCGCEIYYPQQDVHAGGSGVGCSAVVLSGYLLKKIKEGAYQKILFMATGALLSTTSTQQGESIPGVAHAVSIEADVEGIGWIT